MENNFFGIVHHLVLHGGKVNFDKIYNKYWNFEVYLRISSQWYVLSSIENDKDWAPKDIPIDHIKYPYPEYEFLLCIEKVDEAPIPERNIRNNPPRKQVDFELLPKECALRKLEKNTVIKVDAQDIIESSNERLITASPIVFHLKSGDQITFDPNGSIAETVVFY